MQLRLIAVYLDDSQLEYILTIKNRILQENFNFKFEYFDSQNDLNQFYGVNVFPTFLLIKSGFIADRLTGKLDFTELKERLLNLNYVTKNNV